MWCIFYYCFGFLFFFLSSSEWREGLKSRDFIVFTFRNYIVFLSYIGRIHQSPCLPAMPFSVFWLLPQVEGKLAATCLTSQQCVTTALEKKTPIFSCSHPSWCEVVSMVTFICISLITDDFKHIFMSFLAIYTSFLKK